jgi:predicted TPR repeat methyltransferase
VPAPHPWLSVTAADYEGHMGPEGSDQLAPLSEAFGQVYRSVRPARLALLGCATGNGLEHVDPAVTVRAVGLDLNIQYVAVARQRFRHLGARLELYCGDVLSASLDPAAFDLVHAALLFEYVHPELLARSIGGWMAPGGACSVVLQLPGGESPRASRFETIRNLEGAMRLVAPAVVADALAAQGLRRAGAWEVPLRGGKRFHVGVFRR